MLRWRRFWRHRDQRGAQLSDIALVFDPITLATDLEIEENDLTQDGGLETALLWSLFSDRRAELTDVLPDGETDRRGWWADAHPVVENDKFGSRLWLLSRSKETPDVLVRTDEYVREATKWLIDDRVLDVIDVAATYPARGVLDLRVTAHRPNGDSVEFRFHHTWAAQEAQRP